MITELNQGQAPTEVLQTHIFITVTPPALVSLGKLNQKRFQTFVDELPRTKGQDAPIPADVIDDMRNKIEQFIQAKEKTRVLVFCPAGMQSRIYVLCQSNDLSHDDRVKAVQQIMQTAEQDQAHIPLTFDVSNLLKGTSLNMLGVWLATIAESSRHYKIFSTARIH